LNIHWSPEAVLEMSRLFGDEALKLKLVSDSEGCGCSVSGVPTIWVIDEAAPADLQAVSDGAPVWYEERHEVFFDEHLRVTYRPEHRSFQLASDGQIYTNRLRIADHRSENASARS
jgi:uncharacterized protein YqkB